MKSAILPILKSSKLCLPGWYIRGSDKMPDIGHKSGTLEIIKYFIFNTLQNKNARFLFPCPIGHLVLQSKLTSHLLSFGEVGRGRRPVKTRNETKTPYGNTNKPFRETPPQKPETEIEPGTGNHFYKTGQSVNPVNPGSDN